MSMKQAKMSFQGVGLKEQEVKLLVSDRGWTEELYKQPVTVF